MLRKTFVFFAFIFIVISGVSQDWQRTFGADRTCWSYDLIESYDKGYLILNQVDPGPQVTQMYGWLIKTDVNGIVQWNKSFFSIHYQTAFNDFQQTNDNGFIMTGVTTRLDQNDYDITILKANKCGDKEWCKIFSTSENSDYGLRIMQISDGYIALVKYYQDWISNRIWLFKLDEYGNVIWQKLYAQNDPFISNEECRDLLVSADEGYLITGDCYYFDSVSTFWRRRPLIIKTDADGNEQWQLVYGLSSGYRGDVAMCPTQNPTGDIYCSARHFRDSLPYGDSPSFIKFDSSGNELYYRDLVDSTVLGISNTLNFINDSVMIIAASWSNHSNVTDSNGVIKTDTMGNIIKRRSLIPNVVNTFRAATTTFDNKYLVTGSFSVNGADPHIYLYKLNYDLDYDSVYTRPFTYDSLCPHPIVSDTTDLDDCGVITDIKEPVEYEQECRLKVFPNPASGHVTIEMPECLVRKSAGKWVSSMTVYHQWNQVRLDVLDLNGRLMTTKDLPQAEKRVTLDVASWPRGMYLARIVFMNEVVSEAKLILRLID